MFDASNQSRIGRNCIVLNGVLSVVGRTKICDPRSPNAALRPYSFGELAGAQILTSFADTPTPQTLTGHGP